MPMKADYEKGEAEGNQGLSSLERKQPKEATSLPVEHPWRTSIGDAYQTQRTAHPDSHAILELPLITRDAVHAVREYRGRSGSVRQGQGMSARTSTANFSACCTCRSQARAAASGSLRFTASTMAAISS